MKGILGGLLAGLGEGMEKKGAAMREEAREAVRWAREQQARQEERNWRSQESQADRDWRSQEAATDRDFRASQAAVGRSHDYGLLGARQAFEREKWERETQSAAQAKAEKPPETRTIKRGDKEVTQEWDPATREWRDVAEGDRWSPNIGGSVRDREVRRDMALAAGASEEEANAIAAGMSVSPNTVATIYARLLQDPMNSSEDAAAKMDEIFGAGWRGMLQGSQRGRGASGAPPGGGTRDNPYRATSQAQIDWFKQNAPAGAVIEVDGQLYTK